VPKVVVWEQRKSHRAHKSIVEGIFEPRLLSEMLPFKLRRFRKAKEEVSTTVEKELQKKEFQSLVMSRPKTSTEILKHLYLGGHRDAKDAIEIEEDRNPSPITHILNVAKECKNLGSQARKRCPEIKYLKENVSYRSKNKDITETLKSFQPCLDFIHSAREGGRCLVHCARGRSRSTAVVLIYLMAYEKMSLRSAWLYCKKRRPYIGPAECLRPMLVEIDRYLIRRRATTATKSFSRTSLTLEQWRDVEYEAWGNPGTLDEELKEIESEGTLERKDATDEKSSQRVKGVPSEERKKLKQRESSGANAKDAKVAIDVMDVKDDSKGPSSNGGGPQPFLNTKNEASPTKVSVSGMPAVQVVC